MVSVCLCDPQPVVQAGLRAVLKEQDRFEVLECASALEAAAGILTRCRPDILIVDRGFGMHAVAEAAAALSSQFPNTRMVVWAGSISDVECFRLLQAGARGIVKKTVGKEVLQHCLDSVARNQLWTEDLYAGDKDPLTRPHNRPLTPREREVAALVAKGMKNREIAETLGIATGTVKIHLMHIFEKTGIRDRFELALQGLRSATEQGAGARAPSISQGSTQLQDR